MLTYPWKCTVLHCNHLGNTWKPLVLMTRHFDYCPSASEGDNQSVRSSAPVVSRCFPGGYNAKLYISRGRFRLAWWLLAFLHNDSCADPCVFLCASFQTNSQWIFILNRAPEKDRYWSSSSSSSSDRAEPRAQNATPSKKAEAESSIIDSSGAYCCGKSKVLSVMQVYLFVPTTDPSRKIGMVICNHQTACPVYLDALCLV